MGNHPIWLFQGVFNSTPAETFANTNGSSLAQHKSGMPFMLAIAFQALLYSFNEAVTSEIGMSNT